MDGLLVWCLVLCPFLLIYTLYSAARITAKADKDPHYRASYRHRWEVNRTKISAALFVISLCVVVPNLKSAPQTSATPETPRAKSVENNVALAMAAVLCKQRVKDVLKAPSTADFPFFDLAVFGGYNTATLNSYVDAQNSFGAKIRTRFTCKVQHMGDDPDKIENWKIVEFAILE
ncbi:MAG: hypothetical protein PW788_00790 [Micavibrio sp.]|nr:hypothetical protein [Micavibrio sp.]